MKTSCVDVSYNYPSYTVTTASVFERNSDRRTIWQDLQTLLMQCTKYRCRFCAEVSKWPGCQNESYTVGGLHTYCKYCLKSFSLFFQFCNLRLFIFIINNYNSIHFQDFMHYDKPKQPILCLLKYLSPLSVYALFTLK